MDISIYAIKVGKSSIEKLNFNNEFEVDEVYSIKDNPDYEKKEKVEIDESIKDDLPVYDYY